jgi:hypothetical protein
MFMKKKTVLGFVLGLGLFTFSGCVSVVYPAPGVYTSDSVRPYYYYNGVAYYDGVWSGGYYYWRGQRFYGGHYYSTNAVVYSNGSVVGYTQYYTGGYSSYHDLHRDRKVISYSRGSTYDRHDHDKHDYYDRNYRR